VLGALITTQYPLVAGAESSKQIDATIAFINANKPDVQTPCSKYSIAQMNASVKVQADFDLCQSRVLLGGHYPNQAFTTYFRSWGENERRYAEATLANVRRPHSYSAAALNRYYNAYISKAIWYSSFFARWISRQPYVLGHLELLTNSKATSEGDLYWFDLHTAYVSCQIQMLRHAGAVSLTSNIYCDNAPGNRNVVLYGDGRTKISVGNSNGPLNTPKLPARGVVADGAISCSFTATSIHCQSGNGAGFVINGRSISLQRATTN